MRRVEGPQTPYEVYCYRCRVSFPAEARRCMHCGERLSASGEAPSLAVAAGVPESPRLPTRSPGPIPAREEEEESVLAVRRFGVPAVWALVALSAILSNLCEGRG